MNLYRFHALDIRNDAAPAVISGFCAIADGEGKYREAWQDVTAMTNGKKPPHGAVTAVFSDATLKTPLALPHGDAIKLVMMNGVKTPKAKTVSQDAIAAIMADAKLDDAAKTAAVRKLLAS